MSDTPTTGEGEVEAVGPEASSRRRLRRPGILGPVGLLLSIFGLVCIPLGYHVYFPSWVYLSSIAGLIVSSLGLLETRRGRTAGRWVAVTGVVVACVALSTYLAWQVAIYSAFESFAS